jgi:hypothetical protein
MRSPIISRGRLVVTALLATLVVLGAAAPAAARSARTPGKLLSSTMAADLWFCTENHPQALCTSTNDFTNLWGGATYNSTRKHLLWPAAAVWIHCYVWGEIVNGDGVWYYVTKNQWGTEPGVHRPEGYVPGYYLNTGPDPHPGVSRCNFS